MTRVLIVDDVPANLYLLEATLKGYGYEVVSTRNGSEALQEALKNPPDLVISDILMPVMDGFELCRQWKDDQVLKNIPFIIYTATYTDSRDEELSRSLGADQFVIKPQRPEVLVQIVRDTLDAAQTLTGESIGQPVGDEKEILKQYNEVLFRKLEKKVAELEDDIIKRRRIEDELSEKQEFLDTIVENIPDMVFVKDAADLRYLLFNRSCEEQLGYSRGEVIGKSDGDVFPVEEANGFTVRDREVLSSGTILDVPRETISTRNKGKRICHTKKIPVCDAEGNPKYLLGISEDITKRVLVEESLNRATKKLALLNGITFDDIQNAVYSLSGYLELEKSIAADEVLRQYLQKQTAIIESIRDSLVFARNYQDLGQKNPAWQNIQLTFLYAVSHIDLGRISRDLRIEGLEVYADPLLEKVFFVLAENVIRHAGAVETISLHYHINGTSLTLVFEDNGAGIPEKMKELIFRKRYEGKNGMGLFLVREILSITDITIKETGVPGKGARFEMTIPREAYRLLGMTSDPRP